jgi:hypothetical protein
VQGGLAARRPDTGGARASAALQHRRHPCTS